MRGHFDVNTPAGTQRYYCLVDPKTGMREENGVSGQLVARRDGTTGIKGAAVTFYRCDDAEQKGLLVTTGYLVRNAARGEKRPAATTQGSQQTPAAQAPSPALAAPAAPADVLTVYTRFVAGQNAHDRAALSELLLNSKDFVWADYSGQAIWGYQQALDAFEKGWNDSWTLEPQLQEARIAEISPGVALLVTPLQLSGGPPGGSSSVVPLRWSGVFVKTRAGWRISSIFTTPREQGHAERSD